MSFRKSVFVDKNHFRELICNLDRLIENNRSDKEIVEDLKQDFLDEEIKRFTSPTRAAKNDPRLFPIPVWFLRVILFVVLFLTIDFTVMFINSVGEQTVAPLLKLRFGLTLFMVISVFALSFSPTSYDQGWRILIFAFWTHPIISEFTTLISSKSQYVVVLTLIVAVSIPVAGALFAWISHKLPSDIYKVKIQRKKLASNNGLERTHSKGVQSENDVEVYN